LNDCQINVIEERGNYNLLSSICIVGAPCTGKSSVLELLRKKHNHEFTVAFLEETATRLLEEVPSFRPLSPAFFQASITATQLLAEEAVFNAFTQNGFEDALLITDRGVFDYLCYTTKEQEEFLGTRFVFSKYNLVIYLESGDRYLGTQGNPYRNESPEEIKQLAEKTRMVWKEGADTYVEIPFCESIEEKASMVANAINEFIGQPVFQDWRTCR
jgi:hypothetical protein